MSSFVIRELGIVIRNTKMKKNVSKAIAAGININPKPCRPSGDAFWNQADAFRQAADALHEVLRKPRNMQNIAVPMTFLYFRSLELGFKACLPVNKYDGKATRGFGHNLTALLNVLETDGILSGLGMARQDFELIDDFSNDYSDKWMEYGPGFIKMPRDSELDVIPLLVGRFLRESRLRN